MTGNGRGRIHIHDTTGDRTLTARDTHRSPPGQNKDAGPCFPSSLHGLLCSPVPSISGPHVSFTASFIIAISSLSRSSSASCPTAPSSLASRLLLSTTCEHSATLDRAGLVSAALSPKIPAVYVRRRVRMKERLFAGVCHLEYAFGCAARSEHFPLCNSAVALRAPYRACQDRHLRERPTRSGPRSCASMIRTHSGTTVMARTAESRIWHRKGCRARLSITSVKLAGRGGYPVSSPRS